PCTASPSSTSTSRSNGVNCPTVRFPVSRSSTSSTKYTTDARSTISHHGTDSSHISAITTHSRTGAPTRHSPQSPENEGGSDPAGGKPPFEGGRAEGAGDVSA